MLGEKAFQAVKPHSKAEVGGWQQPARAGANGRRLAGGPAPRPAESGWTGKRGPPSGSSWHCLLSGCLAVSAEDLTFHPRGCMCRGGLYPSLPLGRCPRSAPWWSSLVVQGVKKESALAQLCHEPAGICSAPYKPPSPDMFGPLSWGKEGPPSVYGPEVHVRKSTADPTEGTVPCPLISY